VKLTIGTSRHSWTLTIQRQCLQDDAPGDVTQADALVERAHPDDVPRRAEMDSRPIGFLPPLHGGYRPVKHGRRPSETPKPPTGRGGS
jgi:hypothetical protein